jgi:hypothetical protein
MRKSGVSRILAVVTLAAAMIVAPAASPAAEAAVSPNVVTGHYVHMWSITGTVGPNHASTPHWYTRWNAANCVNVAIIEYEGPHDWWEALVSARSGTLWESPLQLAAGNVCSPWKSYNGNVWTTVGVGAATYIADIGTWTYTNT